MNTTSHATPSKAECKNAQKFVFFKDGTFSQRASLEHAASEFDETVLCMNIVFAPDTSFGGLSRKEIETSCRKIARDESEAGLKKGLMMALAHVRNRIQFEGRPLQDVAVHLVRNGLHTMTTAK